VFQMVSHGIVSAALFLCVGVVYDRMHTREIAAYGGLVNRCRSMRWCSWSSPWPMSAARHLRLRRRVHDADRHLQGLDPDRHLRTTGVILSAAYALWLYRKVIFGTLRPSLASIKDITFREGLTLMPLMALTILFGFYPKPVLDMSAASVQQLVNNYNTAVTAVKAAALLQ
jgi:NADH:ubiquinone oxidoreductase subunit 4 (chain M)